jgi:hypothetical protein
MEMEISSNVKFLKLYPSGEEKATIGANIGAFRSIGSQLTGEIFVAHDHTAGVHNASLNDVPTP